MAFLKREDVDWRKFNLDTAKEVYKQQGLGASRVKAFVLDDSVKCRRGKKMEGVSCHYDHLTNRHVVMGQQVLTLGLATDETFLPLDSQIYVSRREERLLHQHLRFQRYRAPGPGQRQRGHGRASGMRSGPGYVGRGDHGGGGRLRATRGAHRGLRRRPRA